METTKEKDCDEYVAPIQEEEQLCCCGKELESCPEAYVHMTSGF